MKSNVPTERDAVRKQRSPSQTYAEQSREWSDHRGGSRGAAGPCKRISPVTGEVVEVIKRDTQRIEASLEEERIAGERVKGRAAD